MADNISNVKVLADMKIMDAADYEVSQAIKFGADVITILGVAEDASIKAAIEEAHKNNKQLLVDMIAVQDLEKRAKELDEMGADYIAVHTGYDLQAEGQSPLESLRTVKSVIKNSKVAVTVELNQIQLKKLSLKVLILLLLVAESQMQMISRSCKTMSRCNRR